MSRRKALGTAAKVGAAVVATAVVAGGGAYYAGTLSAPSAPSAGATATTTITAPGTTTTQTVTQTASGGGGGGGGLSGEIKLGGVHQLSAWPVAKLEAVCEAVAVKDVNAWLDSINAGFTISIHDEDTGGSAATALQKVQLLQAQGINKIIGTDSSGELTACLDYADSNHIVMFSPSSTDDRLAVPGHFKFRGALRNYYEAAAFIAAAKQLGYKFVGIINNQQAGDDDLANTVEKGGADVGYKTFRTTYAPSETDFSSNVSLLAQNVKAAIAQYGADKVCVRFDALAETASVLKATDGYPELESVVWWGDDGTAQLDDVLKEAGPESAKVKLLSTLFGVSSTPYTTQIAQKLKQAAGEDVGTYGLIAYDIVWLMTYEMLLTRSADPVVMQQNMIPISQHFYGTTGWWALDNTGDRAYGTQEYWGYRQSASGGYEYYNAGVWDASTGQITWSVPPY